MNGPKKVTAARKVASSVATQICKSVGQGATITREKLFALLENELEQLEQENRTREEIVRVLRLVEFEGPRELVEKQIAHSVHGTRVFQPKPDGREVRITAVTLDCFPEVLELARQTPEPALLKELRERIQRLEAQVKLSEGE